MSVSYEMKKPQSNEDLNRLEQALKLNLSLEVRKFLLQWCGAEMEENVFHLENNNSNVRHILTVDEILEYRPYLDDINDKAFPFTIDSCGNFVIIDLDKGGAVFFWDHECWNDDMEKLADNPDEFLLMLQPYSY